MVGRGSRPPGLLHLSEQHPRRRRAAPSLPAQVRRQPALGGGPRPPPRDAPLPTRRPRHPPRDGRGRPRRDEARRQPQARHRRVSGALRDVNRRADDLRGPLPVLAIRPAREGRRAGPAIPGVGRGRLALGRRDRPRDRRQDRREEGRRGFGDAPGAIPRSSRSSWRWRGWPSRAGGRSSSASTRSTTSTPTG